MAIVNGFHDVRLVLSELSEADIRRLVKDREFSVIKVPPEVYNYPSRFHYLKFDLTGSCAYPFRGIHAADR